MLGATIGDVESVLERLGVPENTEFVIDAEYEGDDDSTQATIWVGLDGSSIAREVLLSDDATDDAWIVESLAQVRERRSAERRARREQVERRWVKSVGEVARFDGFEPTSDPD